MITGVSSDGKLITVAVDLVSNEDVKKSLIPNLTPIKVVSPVACQFAENSNAVFVKTDDENIHIITIMQFSNYGLDKLNLPQIINKRVVG